MRKSSIIAFILILSLNCFSQAKEQIVSEKLSIIFPGSPVKIDNTPFWGTDTYQFKNTLNEIYSSSSSDLDRLGSEEQTNDAFWERHKNQKIELFNKKNINVEGTVVDFKGHKAVLIKFDGSNSTDSKYLNQKGYVYYFLAGKYYHELKYMSTTDFNKTNADQFFETAKNIK